MYYTTYRLTHERVQQHQQANQRLWDWSQEINITDQPPIIIPSNTLKIIYTATPNADYNIAQTHNLNVSYIDTQLKALLRHVEEIPSSQIHREYSTFTIPKASGGVRTITAPSQKLKEFQKSYSKILLENLFMYPHNAVHSYMEGRGIKSALSVHQAYQSHWFLKMDIHDFFPSITTEILVQNLTRYANYQWWRSKTELHAAELARIDELLLYRNSLPQGSPASPLLSNLVLLSFDLALTEALQTTQEDYAIPFCYTRYADDLLISSPINFRILIENIEAICENLLYEKYHMHIKHEKTRYGSRAGRNWNLGLMLNKDNEITIGHERKQRLKSDIYNFLKKITPLEGKTEHELMQMQQEAYVLFGIIAHFQNIEPEYASYILTKYERQFNINFKDLYKIFG